MKASDLQLANEHRAIGQRPILFRLWWYVMHFSFAQKAFLFFFWVVCFWVGALYGAYKVINDPGFFIAPIH